jgi:hypothetical protein
MLLLPFLVFFVLFLCFSFFCWFLFLLLSYFPSLSFFLVLSVSVYLLCFSPSLCGFSFSSSLPPVLFLLFRSFPPCSPLFFPFRLRSDLCVLCCSWSSCSCFCSSYGILSSSLSFSPFLCPLIVVFIGEENALACGDRGDEHGSVVLGTLLDCWWHIVGEKYWVKTRPWFATVFLRFPCWIGFLGDDEQWFKKAPFSTEMVIFNLVPEHLTFNNWVPNQGKSPFF